MTALRTARTPTRPRAAASALGAGLLAAVVATVGATPTASAAPEATRTHRTPTKTRLLDALRRGDTPAPPTSAAARSAAAEGPTLPAAPSFAPTRDGAPRAAASPTCATLSLDWTLGHDWVVLAWSGAAGGPYTVERVREGGSPTTLATGFTGTTFTDTAVDTQGLVRYRVTPRDGTRCTTEDLSMATDDGYGEPEAAVGQVSSPAGDPRGMLLQDTWSLGVTSQLEGVDPSFSPDGRRVVGSIEVGPMTRVLSVQAVFPARELLRNQAPADTVALDPEWSRDGRRIAYTRYTLDHTTHDVTTTQLRLLDVTTGDDSPLAGSAGLIQPDWVSNTQLVAAGAAPASGLSYLPAAGGTPTPIADTANAAQPDLGAQSGWIWFVSDDGTTSRISAVVRRGPESVGTVRESTSVVYDQPRTADRDLDRAGTSRMFHVEVGPGADPDDPADDTAVVVESDLGPNPARTTPVGASREGDAAPWGYDLRRPASKGTSDVTGDGHGDIVARDSDGTLWAYPYTAAAPAGPRERLGSGWGIYDTFLVAGDLTGDGRADILARDRSGVLWRYDGRGRASLAPRVRVGTGWGGYLLVAPGDWDGDGFADLIARSPSGELWRYPVRPGGTIAPRTRIGTGWNSMNAVIGAGDFDLDGDPDLLAREASTGTLWLYPFAANGRNGFGPRHKVGAGWNVFTQLSSPEIIAGSPVVHAVTRAGELLLYRVVGDGRFDGNEVYRIGTGWKSYTISP